MYGNYKIKYIVSVRQAIDYQSLMLTHLIHFVPQKWCGVHYIMG